MKKKLLAGLVSMCLLVGLLPTSAFAASCDGAECAHVAAIGAIHYDTLAEAISDAGDDTTIELLQDVTEDVTIADSQTITLDLNGKALTNANANHTISNAGMLTITGNGTVDNVNHGRAALYNSGVCTVKNGSFTRSMEASTSTLSSGGNSWYVVYNSGIMMVEDGTFKFSDANDGKFSSLMRNCGSGADLTINGGTFVSGFIAVKNDEQGTLNINNGSISGADQAVQSWNAATISGGELTGHVYAWSSVWNGVAEIGRITISGDAKITGDVASIQYLDSSATEAETPAEIQIAGGTIDGSVFVGTSGYGGTSPTNPAKVVVSGGAFSQPVQIAYLDPALTAQLQNADTSYYTYHADMDAAQAAATSGDTVTDLGGEIPQTYYTVTIVNNDTQEIQFVTAGSEIALDDPTLDGYIFDGWYISGNKIEFPYIVNGSVTIEARWIENTDTEEGGSTGDGSAEDGSDDDDWTDSSSSGSSDSYDEVYSIVVEDVDNGEIQVDADEAEEGETVTIYVEPDDGYELSWIEVIDKYGDELDVTDVGDGEYTFTMPDCKVYIDASFAEIEDMFEMTFVDVFSSDYYYDAVAWAVEQGITAGTTETTFSPGASCPRAQMVVFLWRAAGSPSTWNTYNPFVDVSADAYYYDAVLWAVEQGITAGTTAATFSPDATLTRGQIVTFLYRAAGSPSFWGDHSFADVAGDAYYADAVMWAAEEGITTGTSATTFSPDAACTRGQIVTFLYRDMAE